MHWRVAAAAVLPWASLLSTAVECKSTAGHWSSETTNRQTTAAGINNKKWREKKRKRTWLVNRRRQQSTNERTSSTRMLIVGCDLTYWLTFPHLTTQRSYWLDGDDDDDDATAAVGKSLVSLLLLLLLLLISTYSLFLRKHSTPTTFLSLFLSSVINHFRYLLLLGTCKSSIQTSECIDTACLQEIFVFSKKCRMTVLTVWQK